MYYDTTRLTPLRIAEAQRQADLERLVRAVPAVTAEVLLPVDTRAAGEPIAESASVSAASQAATPSAVADCGECRTADQAA